MPARSGRRSRWRRPHAPRHDPRRRLCRSGQRRRRTHSGWDQRKAGGATDRNDPAGRLRLLEANVKVYQDIVPKLVKATPNAVFVVATDPPEPLVDVARQLAGHDRVMGTSTYLDSLRFRLRIGERLGVGPGESAWCQRGSPRRS